MSIAHSVSVEVSDHAMWQAALRFRRFRTELIEQEVRSALAGGRVSPSRAHLGLHHRADPASLYAWTELPDGWLRVYALRVDRDDDARWIVTTTMRGRTRGWTTR